jgi:hypothetical protein
MKYLESYKSNKLDKVNLSNKIVDIRNKFISGQYMIFIYTETNFISVSGNFLPESSDILFLCKIGNVEHVNHYVSYNGHDILNKMYLHVLILDFITEIEFPNTHLGKKVINIDDNKNLKQILFRSNSLKDAQNKFDELKIREPYSDWALKQNLKKFNI